MEPDMALARGALDTYLNDHYAGSTLGRDHAEHLAEDLEQAPSGPELRRIAVEIDEDRDALAELMERLGMPAHPVKQAGAWVAEKAGRFKFSGASSGDKALGQFLALEALTLGVAGKLALWRALTAIAPVYPEIQATDLTRLTMRAESQLSVLEGERMAAAARTLGTARSDPDAAQIGAAVTGA